MSRVVVFCQPSLTNRRMAACRMRCRVADLAVAVILIGPAGLLKGACSQNNPRLIRCQEKNEHAHNEPGKLHKSASGPRTRTGVRDRCSADSGPWVGLLVDADGTSRD